MDERSTLLELQLRSTPEIIQFIKIAHKGQKDKCGEEYWRHPYNVFLRMPKELPLYIRHAALLHDVLEDTPYQEDMLKFIEINPETIEIVKIVSKLDHRLTYHQWIDQIVQLNNIGAIIVKIADIFDNMSPNRLFQGSESLIHRYSQALTTLYLGLPEQYYPWFESQKNNPY